MKITVLCVGKIKESFYREAIEEYRKRITPFAKLEIAEVSESKLPKNPSAADILQSIEEEGANICAKIPQKAFVLGLFIEGQSYSSEALARHIEKEQQNGSEFVFVIGGSNGLSKAVADRCKIKLSFSQMTFPHQLMRVILCEQLYRAMGILSGNQYHK